MPDVHSVFNSEALVCLGEFIYPLHEALLGDVGHFIARYDR